MASLMKSYTTTTQLDEAAVSPKALSPKDAARYLGISRSLLYTYLDINGGPIRTKLLKRRGGIRGRRLICVDSLNAFLNQLEEE